LLLSTRQRRQKGPRREIQKRTPHRPVNSCHDVSMVSRGCKNRPGPENYCGEGASFKAPSPVGC
jgi:hypothetical protein